MRTEAVGNADRAFDRPQIGGGDQFPGSICGSGDGGGGVEWRRRKVNSNQKIGQSTIPEMSTKTTFVTSSYDGTEEELVIKGN